jgi:3-deoxy-D-arabino-heptulosonate 7-phosphate (DAHP) synthase
VAVGADGIMVEVHPRPEEALSDGEQSLTIPQFESLMAAVLPVHERVAALRGDPAAVEATVAIGGGRH